MSYIEVENAGVIYNAGSDNQVDALSGINLKIEKDEFVVFFGPSGCGKTTLLNLISGLEKPSYGRVLVDGVDISGFNADQMARFHCEKIGMVFQAYNLISSLSVIDNVTLPRIFLGDSDKKSRKKRAKALLEKFGVGPQANKYPAQLSGGQQQRIGIARSLINEQPLILADEPVGNLDSKSASNVLELLQELNQKEGKTIIMVTHNAEHLSFADHIFYLKDGKITNETFNPKKHGRDITAMKPEEKEFELLSRSFTGLSVAQLNVLMIPFKAKVLADHLENPLDYDQNQRLEEMLGKRLSGEMSADELRRFLDEDYGKGGVGLNFQTAQKYSFAVEELLSNVHALQMDLTPIASQLGLEEQELRAKLIVRYFIKMYLPDVTKEQLHFFEKIIYRRLNGEIDNEMVFHLLDAPQSDGGAGLDSRFSRKVVENLELILLVKFSQAHPRTQEEESQLPHSSNRKLNLISDDLKRIEELIKTHS